MLLFAQYSPKIFSIELLSNALTLLNKLFETHSLILFCDSAENSLQKRLCFAVNEMRCAVVFGQFAHSAFIECVEQCHQLQMEEFSAWRNL
jgi:hypothetical protein